MIKPYIGVTDFTSRSQVERAKAAIPANVNRRLHVGAMTSYKVIRGIPTSKGWEYVWLNEQGLRELFANDPEVYNVIHYADYDHTQENRAPTTVLDLVTAWDRCGPYVDAIQLDMVWPRKEMLEEFRHCRPDAEIILQVGSKALDQAGRYALDILDEYYGLAHYALLDAGMGTGTPFDPEAFLQLIDNTDFPPFQLAVAGGLGPDTYSNLQPLLDEYPELSCDAQSRLRQSHNSLDPLDMGRVIAYIEGVCSLIR